MKNDPSKEAEILQMLAQGNEYAFIYIFERYQRKVFSDAFKLLKSHDLAMDVVQEVFIQVWNKRAVFAEVENIASYIFTMTRNLTLNSLRERAAEVAANYNYVLRRDTVDNAIENTISDQHYENLVMRAIQKLTPQQREIFELSRQEGLSQQEIASRKNISSNTVNNHMTTALKSVREDMKPHLGVTLPVLLRIFDQL